MPPFCHIRKPEDERMHKHLTWTDRLKIEKGLKEGLKPCAIADRLHVHNTTIYRELKRGRYTHLNSELTTEERYSPEIAQQRYEENLKAKGSELKIGNDYELAAFEESRPRAAGRKHRGTPAGNQRSANLRTLGRRLRMREEADEGNLVRSFRALDAAGNNN